MFHCAKQRQHGPKSRSAMFPKTRAQVSTWSHREESCWQRGFLRKYPLRWFASHKSRLWHKRFLLSVLKKMVADEKKGRKTVQWATIQMKCRFCMYDLCVCVLQLKKKKRKRWKMERNKHHWAGRPLVSFGELRLSTITAQSLSRNPELGKRKPGLSFPLFLQVLITFTQPLLPSSLCTSFCSFLFLVVLLCLVTSPWFVMCIIYSLDSAWTHLEALKAAQHCCINVFFCQPVWGLNKIYWWCKLG